MNNPRSNLYWTGDRVSFITKNNTLQNGEIIGYSIAGDTIRHYYVRTKDLSIIEVQEKDIKTIQRKIGKT